MKLCTVCGVVTSRPGSRCTEHARQSNRSRHNALYGTRAWQRLSARVLRAWRGEHGNWCPGYQRDAHPASDLTVDHVVPLAAGGAPFDIGNCAVLCRSCNSTKGAGDADRGSPHAGSALLEVRASQSCARGRVSRKIPVAPDAANGHGGPRAPQGAGVAR
jgi:5-methylcytosine-specific restriction enzyme A